MKILAAFLSVSFILWIMPLGFLIKPSDEKLFCDGQRAMCMCHVTLKPAALDHAMEAGTVLKAIPSARENSGSAANYFVSARTIIHLHALPAIDFGDPFAFYRNPYLNPIESVPRF